MPMTHSSPLARRPRTWVGALAAALIVAAPALGTAAPAGAASAPAPVSTAVVGAPAPTATAAPAPRTYKLGQRTLRRGDKGKDVRKLQKLLRVKKTSYFNAKTERAVKKVERKYDLRVDGVVDATTLKAVKKAAKARARGKKASRGMARAGAPAASKRYARAYIDRKYDWSSRQMRCLSSLWERESGWRYWASNPNGRYHGIPQTSSGVWRASGYSTSEYMNDPRVQIKVGTRYIKKRYGTPCKAWSFWRSHHWY